MNKVLYELDKLKNNNNYKKILEKLIENCNERIEQFTYEKHTKSIRRFLQKNHHELIKLLKIKNKDIHFDEYDFEDVITTCHDKNIYGNKNISYDITFGPFEIHYEFYAHGAYSCLVLLSISSSKFEIIGDTHHKIINNETIKKICVDMKINEILVTKLLNELIADMHQNIDELIN